MKNHMIRFAPDRMRQAAAEMDTNIHHVQAALRTLEEAERRYIAGEDSAIEFATSIGYMKRQLHEGFASFRQAVKFLGYNETEKRCGF